MKEQLKTWEDIASELKKLESLEAERRKPELLSDIELLLETFNVQHEAYHGGDFNGVCCRRIVGNTANLFLELRVIMKIKKDESCEESKIDEKLDKLEMLSGLLDTAFVHLNISYPNEDDESKARQATLALSDHWRKIGLNITLKARIMEKHVFMFSERWD